MSKNYYTIAAGVAGALTIPLSAFGAHGLTKAPEEHKDIWKTATNFQWVHALLLFGIGSSLTGTKRRITGSLILTGLSLFSGSIYAIVLTGKKEPFSYVVPVGGLTLLSGWLAIALL